MLMLLSGTMQLSMMGVGNKIDDFLALAVVQLWTLTEIMC